MLKEHPAYREELAKLEMTNEEVEIALSAYANRLAKLRSDTNEILKQFKHNPDEGSQAYIELMTGTEQIKFYTEKLKGLTRTKEKPYFARIDFTPEGTDTREVCYVGKTGLTRETDNEVIIIDWRAPIATLYYEGRLGESSYTVPIRVTNEEELITGELSLKRQYTIEDGELQDIFDIDITTNDPLLQKALGANADNRLKDIAETIQAEQNRIIRAGIKSPLIVQGVAGSGKTTIALHRIAYLIYTYANMFDPDTFMIIAPNQLFLNYISEVLPELGVEYVKQTTFIDFMLEHLSGKFKLKNTNQMLINLVNKNNLEREQTLMVESARFKGSLFFKRIIDKFVKDIEENFLPRSDLKIGNNVVVPASEIRSIFLSEYKYYPIYKRASKLRTRLKRAVKKSVTELIAREEARADHIIEIFSLKSSVTEEERQQVLKIAEERDHKIKELTKAQKKLVDDYIDKLPKLKLLDYYTQLVTDPDTLDIYSGGELSDQLLGYIANQAKSMRETIQIELEDLAPLVYLKLKLYGFRKRLRLNHVVVDEAQDFSLFQFYMMKRLSNTESFSIMGDLSQGIHSYRAIKNWDEVITNIFPKTESTFTTLEQSYRTTIEIMNLANEVIKHYQKGNNETLLAKPIIRHGQLPYLIRNNSPQELVKFLISETKKLQTEEMKSIAIICKTMDECKKLYNQYPKNARPLLISEDMTEYHSGIMIMPSYLAKGLEFDCVFIITLDVKYEEKELDIKLLYIAMTRALHYLYLCSIDEISPMVTDIDPELYQIHK